MIRLDEKLETELEIEGVIYPVNMAFGNVLKFLNIASDPTVTEAERIYYSLYILLGKTFELSIEKQGKILDVLVDNFIKASKVAETNVDLEGNIIPEVKKPPTYDLNHDAGSIYASFVQAYSIDLFEVQDSLDWRKFQLLLEALPSNTRFKQIVEIRTRSYPKGKGMSEERKKLKELKKIYTLPNSSIDDDY